MNKIAASVVLIFFEASISIVDPESKSERNAISHKKNSQTVGMYIKSEMTDFEKVLILHEYISDRLNYGKFNNKTDAYTAPAPLKGCYISVEICSSTFTKKERIKYTDRIFIPAGKKLSNSE